MQQRSLFSRRRAAVIIAGGWAASASAASYAAPAAGTSGISAGNSLASDGLEADMLASLSKVRRARGLLARAEAFDRFKRVLDTYDIQEILRTNNEKIAARNSSTLYRSRNPGSLLTTVIVRELDAWPRSDARWMGRFADLEAAIRTRVGIA